MALLSSSISVEKGEAILKGQFSIAKSKIARWGIDYLGFTFAAGCIFILYPEYTGFVAV